MALTSHSHPPKIASIAAAAEVISSAIWCRYTALVTVELM
jgi:hypothetical protein